MSTRGARHKGWPWQLLWLAVLLAFCLLTGCDLDAQPGGRAGQQAVPGLARATPVDVVSLAVDTAPAGRMLFVAQGDLWIWQAGKTRRLTRDGHWSQPAWSPDGNQIASVRHDNGASDLFILDSEGRKPRSLTALGSKQPPGSYERIYEVMWAFYPAWSPDGASIVFASQESPPFGSPATDHNLSLYVVPVSGGQRQQIVADESAHFGRVSYDPLGGQVAVTRFPAVGDSGPRVYRYTLEGGEGAPFRGVSEQSYDPAFSPDGRLLGFAARNDQATDIYLVPTDDAQDQPPQRLTSHGRARAPAFSPDGRSLAFLADGPDGFQLWVMPLDLSSTVPQAGTPVQLTSGPSIDVDSGISWAP